MNPQLEHAKQIATNAGASDEAGYRWLAGSQVRPAIYNETVTIATARCTCHAPIHDLLRMDLVRHADNCEIAVMGTYMKERYPKRELPHDEMWFCGIPLKTDYSMPENELRLVKQTAIEVGRITL